LRIKQALQDFNIEIVTLNSLHEIPARPAELWSWIDDPSTPQHAAADLRYLETGDGPIFLPFEVRYQLEVCISRDILNEHNITKAFVKTLSEMASKDPAKARNILEYVAEQEKRIHNPMSIFEDKEALAFSPKTKIPHYCAYVRKATITPTTIYFSSPTVETTNRVLRHYARENEDGRFLRVQFTDEMAEVRQSLSHIFTLANTRRAELILVLINKEMMNSLREFIGLSTMASALETVIISS
jgi:RNA-dependent RNA polymerase